MRVLDSGSARGMKAWLAWSSGKDAAWALHVLREAVPEQGEVEVVGLLWVLAFSAAR